MRRHQTSIRIDHTTSSPDGTLPKTGNNTTFDFRQRLEVWRHHQIDGVIPAVERPVKTRPIHCIQPTDSAQAAINTGECMRQRLSVSRGGNECWCGAYPNAPRKRLFCV